MTHLESLIAKAKAAIQGESETPGSDGDTFAICAKDSKGKRRTLARAYGRQDAEYIAAASPHLILALCELAMAAEEVERTNGATYAEWGNFLAKLAAVRGVESQPSTRSES